MPGEKISNADAGVQTPITDSYYGGRRQPIDLPKRRVPWLSTLPYAALGLCVPIGIYLASQFTLKIIDPLIEQREALKGLTERMNSSDRALVELNSRVQYGLQRREALQLDAASQEERLKALQREAETLQRRIEKLEQEQTQRRRR